MRVVLEYDSIPQIKKRKVQPLIMDRRKNHFGRKKKSNDHYLLSYTKNTLILRVWAGAPRDAIFE